jgi:hypothetical protein
MLLKAAHTRKKSTAGRIQNENKRLLNSLMYIQNGSDISVGHHVVDHKVQSLYYGLWKRQAADIGRENYRLKHAIINAKSQIPSHQVTGRHQNRFFTAMDPNRNILTPQNQRRLVNYRRFMQSTDHKAGPHREDLFDSKVMETSRALDHADQEPLETQ